MHTVKAIILKSIPHSEQQQILHVYSEERGYMQMITPLALFKRKTNTSVQCMQIVEIEFIPNERGGLHKLKSLSPLVNTSAIYFDVYKMNIALLWGEILNLVLRDSDPNPGLYEYIKTSVEYLNVTRDDIANFNLLFLFRLSKLLGFSIDNSTPTTCSTSTMDASTPRVHREITTPAHTPPKLSMPFARVNCKN